MNHYSFAVVLFCCGLFTTAATVAYVIGGYFKFKNKDPFEGE